MILQLSDHYRNDHTRIVKVTPHCFSCSLVEFGQKLAECGKLPHVMSRDLESWQIRDEMPGGSSRDPEF
jgi:hypothetical protein